MRGMSQQLGNLETISAFACRHRETKKNLQRITAWKKVRIKMLIPSKVFDSVHSRHVHKITYKNSNSAP
jgi:hypothetical protein